MKKMILVLAAIAMSIPAMAGVTLTLSQPVSTERKVRVSYTWDGTGSRPRAFALDVNVDAGTITAVTPTISGESNAPNHKGYGIFMGGINIAADGTVNSWGTPVGDTNDAALPYTKKGLNHECLTLEMGSLYFNGTSKPADYNTPANTGILCTITVSNDCWLTIKGNAIRGNVVLEDASSNTANLPQTIHVVQGPSGVAVPNVVGSSQAAATTTITGAGLVVGTVTQQVDNTKTPGTVLSENPTAGTIVALGSAVNLVVSKYCFPSTYTTYTDFTTYITNGWTPEIFSWCNAYQCEGDADGLTEGALKYRVYNKDMDILLANWKKKMGNRATGADPRADFDHKSEGALKYRVYNKDMDILLAHWKYKDTALPGNCPRSE